MKRCIRTYSHDKELVEQRRHEIYLTAAKLFLKKGYQGTSMRTLAEAVGLSVAGLYHYIGTKDDIIHIILEYATTSDASLVREMRERVADLAPDQALVEAIRMFFLNIDETQDIYNLHNHIVASLPTEYREMLFRDVERFIALFVEIVKKGIEQGYFETESPELVGHNILLIAHGWANRRWFLHKRMNISQYIKMETEQILKSLEPDGNRRTRELTSIAEDTGSKGVLK